LFQRGRSAIPIASRSSRLLVEITRGLTELTLRL